MSTRNCLLPNGRETLTTWPQPTLKWVYPNLGLQAGGEATHVSAEAGVTDTIQLCNGALTICLVPDNVRSQGP